MLANGLMNQMHQKKLNDTVFVSGIAEDTLQRIQDRGILMCGFSEGVWRNDTLELSTFIMNCNLGLTKERPQGTFKFTYYRGRFKRFKMAVSSAIEIYL